MPFYAQKHHRRSIRLRDFDYSQAGAYFITVCTKNRECFWGDVVNSKIHLNSAGQMIEKWCLELMNKFPFVKIDTHVVMPNHFHGIIIINADCRGTLQRTPTKEQFGRPISNSIPTIIRLVKSTTTKQINQTRNTPGIPLWQRNYYEHIIRNEKEFNKIRRYIEGNPFLWEYDRENPNCLPVTTPEINRLVCEHYGFMANEGKN